MAQWLLLVHLVAAKSDRPRLRPQQAWCRPPGAHSHLSACVPSLRSLQGEAEGLLPDAALYQALIQYKCSQGDADGAAALLEPMQVRLPAQQWWERALLCWNAAVRGALPAATQAATLAGPLLSAGARHGLERPGALCAHCSGICGAGAATG